MQLRSRGQAISAITPTNLLMKINHLSDDLQLRQSSVFRNPPRIISRRNFESITRDESFWRWKLRLMQRKRANARPENSRETKFHSSVSEARNRARFKRLRGASEITRHFRMCVRARAYAYVDNDSENSVIDARLRSRRFMRNFA